MFDIESYLENQYQDSAENMPAMANEVNNA
jgi:hypothetical protein